MGRPRRGPCVSGCRVSAYRRDKRRGRRAPLRPLDPLVPAGDRRNRRTLLLGARPPRTPLRSGDSAVSGSNGVGRHRRYSGDLGLCPRCRPAVVRPGGGNRWLADGGGQRAVRPALVRTAPSGLDGARLDYGLLAALRGHLPRLPAYRCGRALLRGRLLSRRGTAGEDRYRPTLLRPSVGSGTGGPTPAAPRRVHLRRRPHPGGRLLSPPRQPACG